MSEIKKLSKQAVLMRRDEFAILIASGLSQKDAYMQTHPDASDATARSAGSALARRSEVKEQIERLREEAFQAKALTRSEKLAYLGDVVRQSPADAIGKNGKVKKKYRHLIQEATVIQSPDGTVATKIKFPSKNEAVRIDNNMQGHDGAVKVEGKLSLSMLLSARDSLEAKDKPEDWG